MNIFKLAMESECSIAEEDMLNGVVVPLDNSVDEVLECRRDLQLASDVFTQITNIRDIVESDGMVVTPIAVDTVEQLARHLNISTQITVEGFADRVSDVLYRIYEYIKSLFKKIVDFLHSFKNTTENNIKSIYRVTETLLKKYDGKTDYDASVKLDVFKDKIYNTVTKGISYDGIANGLKVDINHVKTMIDLLPQLYSMGLAKDDIKIDEDPKLLGFGGYVLNAYQDKNQLVVFSLEKLYPIKQSGDFIDRLPSMENVVKMITNVSDLCVELMLLVKETDYSQKHISEYLASIKETLEQTLTPETANQFKVFQDNAEAMMKVLTITYPKFINYNLFNIKYILEALDVDRIYNRYKV